MEYTADDGISQPESEPKVIELERNEPEREVPKRFDLHTNYYQHAIEHSKWQKGNLFEDRRSARGFSCPP